MASTIFTKDAQMTPYWWQTTPLTPAEPEPASLPARADVVVVGAGYTGLNAALQIARGGRQVLICDAEAAGWGCSSRNGGQVSTSIKPDLDTLSRRHGPEIAREILRDGFDSLDWIEEFVQQERIDCGFARVGRFHAAHNAAAFRSLVTGVRNQPEGFVAPAHVVPRAEQRSELGTDVYFGGVVYEGHAVLDPGRYHAGLLHLAKEAGVQVAAHCPVRDIARDGTGFSITTGLGKVQARDVVLATNGYAGPLSRWHQRRIIPIGSYMIATEELPEAMIDTVIPRNRIVSDTRRVVYYYRASPDRRRILFGGRVGLAETDPARSGPRLHAELVRLFPQLAGTRVSHSWMGFVGYTFDTLAHTGVHDGIHYAMGYCGSGVGMASYLGMRMGQRVLGLPQGDTGVQRASFPTRPFYTGKPWFLAPAVSYYKLRDRFNL